MRPKVAADDLGLATLVFELTSNLLAEKKFAEAEPYARECLAIREKKLPDDWRTFNTRSLLGACLLAQKKFAEAEAFLLSGYEGMERIQGQIPTAASKRLTEAGDRLVQLYEMTGQAERAGVWKKRKALAEAVAEAAALRASGEVHARHGRFTEAAADFARAIELRPADHEIWHWQAAVLVGSGQLEAYGELRHRSLALFANATDPNTAERIAKDFLMLAGAGSDLETATKLANTAVNVATNHPDIAWFRLAKGLAEYRQGRFASTVAWMHQVLGDAGHDVNREAEAYLVLAMAQQQLKRIDEACATLSKGLELVDAKMVKLESSDLGGGWVDWLVAHALMREAKAMIEDNASAARPP